eukprot:gene16414-18049_t
MFLDVPIAHIYSVLRVAATWDDAVDLLSEKFETAESVTSEAVLVQRRSQNLAPNAGMKHLVVRRDELWCNGIWFYKMAVAKKGMPMKDFVVTFENDEGVDGGALKREFFSKFLEAAKQEIFEETSKGGYFAPKRSAANLQLFKMLVTNSSHWPVDTKIYMRNLETLKSMLAWEEVVENREKQLNAMKNVSLMLGFCLSLPAILLFFKHF